MNNDIHKGSALLVVLLILMVMSVLGITLLNMTVLYLQVGKADKFHQAAYYYAEAGLQNQIEVMANYMESLYRESPASLDRNDFYNSMVLHTPIQALSFEEYDGQHVILEIKNKYEGMRNGAAQFTIYSTCTIGKIKRTVKAKVSVRWENPQNSEFGLYKSNFEISQWGETYEGDV